MVFVHQPIASKPLVVVIVVIPAAFVKFGPTKTDIKNNPLALKATIKIAFFFQRNECFFDAKRKKKQRKFVKKIDLQGSCVCRSD